MMQRESYSLHHIFMSFIYKQMTLIIFFLILIFIISYVLGYRRALTIVSHQTARLHSLPSYHGLYVACFSVLPALGLLILWSLCAPYFYNAHIASFYSDHLSTLSLPQQQAFLQDVRTLSLGKKYIFCQ